jgi:hypothetical protein
MKLARSNVERRQPTRPDEFVRLAQHRRDNARAGIFKKRLSCTGGIDILMNSF